VVGNHTLDRLCGNQHPDHHQHPGISYRSNLGFLQLVFGYLVARVVVSFLFIPRYFAANSSPLTS